MANKPMPSKLWAGLGISEATLQATVDAHWLEYAPRCDRRTEAVQKAFVCPLREVTLRQHLYDNAMRILAHLDERPGGVVALAHKMGAKSQVLHYLEGLCHALPANLYVVRIALDGTFRSPFRWVDLFGLLHKHIMDGLLPLCHSFLKEELRQQGVNPVPEFPNDEYQRFNTTTKETVAQHVFAVLEKYSAITTRSDRRDLRDSVYVAFYEALCALLQHPDQAFCYSLFLVDEAGKVFDNTLGRSTVLQEYLSPLQPLVGGDVGTPRFSAVFCGSTLMSALKRDPRRYCHLSYFDAAQCEALWELWKLHANLPDQAKIDAEKLIGDMSRGAEGNLGEVLQDLTDGVPGCLVELFCDVLGVESPHSLPDMLRYYFDDLETSLRRTSITDLFRAIKHHSWAECADFALTPSHDDPPSGPVCRILFELLRNFVPENIDSYGQMLASMAQLELSRSLEGEVFEERVRFQFFRGSGIRVSKMSKVLTPNNSNSNNNNRRRKGAAVVATTPWTEGEDRVMFTCPAQLIMFDGLRFNWGLPLPDTIPADCFLFVPQTKITYEYSLTVPGSLPAISMSVAEIVRKNKRRRGGTVETSIDHVDIYHIAASLRPKHFASFDGASWSRSGHLPLDLGPETPTGLRSPQALAQMSAYRKKLEEFGGFKGAKLNHWYAVANPHATDLASLTSPEFDEDFYVLKCT